MCAQIKTDIIYITNDIVQIERVSGLNLRTYYKTLNKMSAKKN